MHKASLQSSAAVRANIHLIPINVKCAQRNYQRTILLAGNNRRVQCQFFTRSTCFERENYCTAENLRYENRENLESAETRRPCDIRHCKRKCTLPRSYIAFAPTTGATVTALRILRMPEWPTHSLSLHTH